MNIVIFHKQQKKDKHTNSFNIFTGILEEALNDFLGIRSQMCYSFLGVFCLIVDFEVSSFLLEFFLKYLGFLFGSKVYTGSLLFNKTKPL